MDVANPNYPKSDILAVMVIDPDTYLPQSSHSNTDVSLGVVAGVSPISFSGVKSAISDVAQEVVQTRPRTLAPMVGEAMSIVSTSAADIGVSIRVSALGPNGAYIAPFIVVLNGVTPVALGVLSRINGLTRVTGDIAGVINVTGGTGVHGFMEIGSHIMQSAMFTIPAGYRLMIQTIIAAMLKSGGSDGGVIFSLRMKPMAAAVFGPIISMSCYRAGNSQIQVDQEYGGGTPGPMDVDVVSLASVAGCDAQVYVSGMLIDQDVHP